MKYFFVYALIDPQYDEVRYIGISTNPHDRAFLPYTPKRPWQSHVAQALSGGSGSTHKDYWIRKLDSRGFIPILVILEHGMFTKDQIAEREIDWIAYYRSIGANLLNQSNGGEQTVLWSMTPELKQKISEKTKEAMARPEVKRKTAEGTKRYWDQYWIDNPRTPEPLKETSEERSARYTVEMTNQWAGLSDADRKLRGQNISKAKKEEWASEKGLARKKKTAETMSNTVRAYRESLSEEEKEELNKKQGETSKQQWAGMTEQARKDRGLKISLGKLYGSAKKKGWVLDLV